MMVKKVNQWCLVGYFVDYICSMQWKLWQKLNRKCDGETWQVINWHYILSITFQYSESYNIQQPFGSGGAKCHNFYCTCFGVKQVFEVWRGFLYTESLAFNILQKVSLVCYIFKRVKMRKLKTSPRWKLNAWRIEHICVMKIYSKSQTLCMCTVLGHQHQRKYSITQQQHKEEVMLTAACATILTILNTESNDCITNSNHTLYVRNYLTCNSHCHKKCGY